MKLVSNHFTYTTVASENGWKAQAEFIQYSLGHTDGLEKFLTDQLNSARKKKFQANQAKTGSALIEILNSVQREFTKTFQLFSLSYLVKMVRYSIFIIHYSISFQYLLYSLPGQPNVDYCYIGD